METLKEKPRGPSRRHNIVVFSRLASGNTYGTESGSACLRPIRTPEASTDLSRVPPTGTQTNPAQSPSESGAEAHLHISRDESMRALRPSLPYPTAVQ